MNLVVALLVGVLASPTIGELEQAVQRDPENLQLVAEYRQLAIAARDFDRPINVLEKLAKQKGSGPNVQISLALAYVDKVPTSGDIRRLYLGRDAINALGKAIERQPTVLAYWARGVINLFYNNFIFKRIPRGIGDLEHALRLVDAETPSTLVARVYQSLGDGYWRLEQREKAREVWAAGSARAPSDAALRKRVDSGDDHVAEMVTAALYAPNRVDTSLRDLLPARRGPTP